MASRAFPGGGVVIAWVTPSDPSFAGVAALFDEYRVHYGLPAAPAEAHAWLSEQVTSGRLAVATATSGGVVQGFVTSAVLPASLTLGAAWLVRDLFVPPAFRRRGLARALLTYLITAARVAGARRVSLQTEPGNSAALAL
ncbi:MAG: GNAT family N-acetyltransferase, partial [Actinomycetota bacterium]|nr:GNAT family N-acetyltransferase [Actinomycetota bacterium]